MAALEALTATVQAVTFTNTSGLAIPDNGNTVSQTITVSGLPASITSLSLTLTGLTSVRPDDLDFLLVHPNGTANLEVWSDAGSTTAMTARNFTLSDSGASALPDSTLPVAGTYQPADYSAIEDATNWGLSITTINHAQTNGPVTFATAFNSLAANGTWTLYIKDDSISGDAGSSFASWSIDVTAVPEPATLLLLGAGGLLLFAIRKRTL